MARRLGSYSETERVTAALAVTISSLLGAASVAVGLRDAHVSPQRSPLPQAAAGPAPGSGPLPACAACGPDGRIGGGREQERASASAVTTTGGRTPDGSRPVLAVAPVHQPGPTADHPSGGPAPAAPLPAVPLPATPVPATPLPATGGPGTAPAAGPPAPSPAPAGRVEARSTIVDLGDPAGTGCGPGGMARPVPARRSPP